MVSMTSFLLKYAISRRQSNAISLIPKSSEHNKPIILGISPFISISSTKCPLIDFTKEVSISSDLLEPINTNVETIGPIKTLPMKTFRLNRAKAAIASPAFSRTHSGQE
uniref:Uncharacterized protein n=1 Tax=Opuntia streptacantha TaxID=393608 RepID=A0A7C9D116_OPUST